MKKTYLHFFLIQETFLVSRNIFFYKKIIFGSVHMKSTALTVKRWRPKHSLMRGGIHSIYSEEMEPTACTENIWRPQHLHMIDAIVALPLFPVARTQHLLMRDGVHNIFSREMKYMTFSYERWSPQYILKRDEVHDI